MVLLRIDSEENKRFGLSPFPLSLFFFIFFLFSLFKLSDNKSKFFLFFSSFFFHCLLAILKAESILYMWGKAYTITYRRYFMVCYPLQTSLNNHRMIIFKMKPSLFECLNVWIHVSPKNATTSHMQTAPFIFKAHLPCILLPIYY